MQNVKSTTKEMFDCIDRAYRINGHLDYLCMVIVGKGQTILLLRSLIKGGLNPEITIYIENRNLQEQVADFIRHSNHLTQLNALKELGNAYISELNHKA